MKWESIHEPPREVIAAALLLLRWAEARNYKDWCICGIGPYRAPLGVINRTEEAITGTQQMVDGNAEIYCLD